MNNKTITVFDIAKVKSSNIDTIAFGGNSIYVNFLNGTSYSYEGATFNDYEEFKKAESVGKHFHAHIKNAGYEVKQLIGVALQQEGPKSAGNPQLEAEVEMLKKERTDLYQALRMKQEKIEELEDYIQFELKKKEA